MDEERNLRGKVDNGGFTLIEVMIALLLLLIGVAGVLSLQMVSVKATGYSRHATEATILAEDKMEELMTTTSADLVDNNDRVDADGVVNDTSGDYERVWTINPVGALIEVSVAVTWKEKSNTDTHTITIATQRRP